MLDKLSYLNLPNGAIRLSVTNKCNMNCFYCHNEGQSKKARADMNYEEFVRIIKNAQGFGLRGITFTGGEALLVKDLKKMICYCIKIGLEKIDICTNGILIPQKMDILKLSNKISLSLGIDTCQKDKISKYSSIGKTFGYIEKCIFLLKKDNVNFSINSVYTNKNDKDIKDIIEYCIKNEIGLRVIELDTMKHLTNSELTPKYKEFMNKMLNHFKLKIGYAHPGRGYFGDAKNGVRIFFYRAKCHSRACLDCARCHFRISSDGSTLPCYARDFKIPLLISDEKKAHDNFLKSIYNSGIPPEGNKYCDNRVTKLKV